jgi:hypothetical protein
MDVVPALSRQDVSPYDDPAIDSCLGGLADVLVEEGITMQYRRQR